MGPPYEQLDTGQLARRQPDVATRGLAETDTGNNNNSARTSTDFPEPLSPVMTLRPGLNRTTSSETSAKSLMRSSSRHVVVTASEEDARVGTRAMGSARGMVAAGRPVWDTVAA